MIELTDFIPNMLTDSELDNALKVLPKYDNSIIKDNMANRMISLQDIYNIFVPNSMCREIYCKMYLALIRSLQKKKSVLAVKQFGENAKCIRQQTYDSIIGGGDSFLIVGQSGIGKSSSVSRCVRIMCEEPLLFINNSYLIPCLVVQSPADCSVKGLLLEILRKTDELLNTTYYSKAMKSHATVDVLIGTVSQVALNHIILLVIDEIQNVVNGKNGKIIIGTLVQLINNAGISICMVGVPESIVFFEQHMMLARRSLTLNYNAMEYDDEFKSFCSVILSYCYVKTKPNVDEALYMWLYNHSSGNASIIVSLIHDAQELSIIDGYEKIDIAALNKAYNKRLSLLNRFIDKPAIHYANAKMDKVNIPVVSNRNNNKNSILDIVTSSKRHGIDIIKSIKDAGIIVEEVSV